MKLKEVSVSSVIHLLITVAAHALLIIVLAVFFARCLGVIYVAVGSSMKETINNQDVLLVNEMAYSWKDPRRFDLVLFRTEEAYEGVKRVVGLPGETVRIADGNIWINGKILEQSYWPEMFSPGIAEDPVILGSDEYFVLGDNLAFSEDSRSIEIGPIKRSIIEGNVWFCCWPFTNFGWKR